MAGMFWVWSDWEDIVLQGPLKQGGIKKIPLLLAMPRLALLVRPDKQSRAPYHVNPGLQGKPRFTGKGKGKGKPGPARVSPTPVLAVF